MIIQLVSNASHDVFHYIYLIILFSCWIRGFFYLQTFKKTRYLVEMITQVFIDIVAFLFIFIYFTIAFILLYENVDKEHESINKIILMSIGEVED